MAVKALFVIFVAQILAGFIGISNANAQGCNINARAKSITMGNQSGAGGDTKILVASYQLNRPLVSGLPGYIEDTGVVVGATNLPLGASSTTDPCVAKGAPILPTHAEASASVEGHLGTYTFRFDDVNAPPGKYITNASFIMYWPCQGNGACHEAALVSGIRGKIKVRFASYPKRRLQR